MLSRLRARPTGQRALLLLSVLLLGLTVLPAAGVAAADADPGAPTPATAAQVAAGERMPASGGVVVTRSDGSRLPVDVADLGELRDLVEQVERSPEWIDLRPDPLFQAQLSDPHLDKQWSREKLGIPAAHDTATGERVTVAVLDTGVDAGHEDLEGQVLEGYDVIEDAPGGDHDPNGHGTLAAGMVAAIADNGLGIAGAAPDVEILPVRVLDEDGNGKGTDITAGVEWATANGADVLNLSFGGGESDSRLEDALDDALAAGIVVVAAAGNQGNEGNPVLYPGAYESTFAVGATDEDDRVADFSSYGDHLDIAAPGVDVFSTTIAGAGDYGYWSGTSAATPLVSATTALLLEAAGDNPHTADHVADVLESITSTALDVDDPGWDPYSGHGVVQADLAVEALSASSGTSDDTDEGTGEDDGGETEDDGDGTGDGDGAEDDTEPAEACPDSVPTTAFTDTAGSTFEDDIDCMVWWGITAGVSDTEFAPRREVTRAQIATFLHRMLDEADLLPQDASRRSFDDVPAGHTHRTAIETLAGLDVINGVDDDRFAPSRSVTRGQMASLLVRLHEEVLDQHAAPATTTLTDIAGTTHETNIRKLVTLEVTTGYPDDTFRPGRTVVRGQMAAFVMRYVEHLTSNGLAEPRTL